MLFRPGYESEVEARRVVGVHRCLVVGVVVVNEHHALYGVAGFEEVAENVGKVVADVLVAHNFTQLYFSVGVVVQHFKVAQLRAWNGAVFLERLPVDALEDGVAYGFACEAAVDAVFLYAFFRYALSCLPVFQGLLLPVGSGLLLFVGGG